MTFIIWKYWYILAVGSKQKLIWKPIKNPKAHLIVGPLHKKCNKQKKSETQKTHPAGLLKKFLQPWSFVIK